MANKKVTLKKRFGSQYDVIRPETKKANILKDENNPLSTFGASVLDVPFDASQATYAVSAYGETNFTNNELDGATPTEARTLFAMTRSTYECLISGVNDPSILNEADCTAASGIWEETAQHDHPISSVYKTQTTLGLVLLAGDPGISIPFEGTLQAGDACYGEGEVFQDDQGNFYECQSGTFDTPLQDILDVKVPLVGTKIPQEYFPTINSDSLTFAGAVSGSTNAEDAVGLLQGLNVPNDPTQIAFLQSLVDENGNPTTDEKGRFTIHSSEVPGYFKNQTANAPVNGQNTTFNFIFRQLDTTLNNYYDVDDAQETPNDYDAIQLEQGDRIVLTDIVKVSSTEYTVFIDVLNMNTSYGTQAHLGTAMLSSASVLSAMSGTVTASKVVDESTVSRAMKDIVYEEQFEVLPNSDLSFSDLPYYSIEPSIGAYLQYFLNISNGTVYQCNLDPNCTQLSDWEVKFVLPQFARSSIDPATYFIFTDGTTTRTLAKKPGIINRLDDYAPMGNDLVIEIQ